MQMLAKSTSAHERLQMRRARSSVPNLTVSVTKNFIMKKLSEVRKKSVSQETRQKLRDYLARRPLNQNTKTVFIPPPGQEYFQPLPTLSEMTYQSDSYNCRVFPRQRSKSASSAERPPNQIAERYGFVVRNLSLAFSSVNIS